MRDIPFAARARDVLLGGFLSDTRGRFVADFDRMSAGLNGGSARLATIVRVIDAEFEEMPGLRVTGPQARRLWHLSDEECTQVFEQLCRSGLLTQDPTGRFVRRRFDY